MIILFRYFWQLCILKETPDSTPYSMALMNFCAFLFFWVMFIQWITSDSNSAKYPLITIMVGLSLILSYFIYTFSVLLFKGLRFRMVQTLTCLFATHTIIHSLTIPLMIIVPYITEGSPKTPFFLLLNGVFLILILSISVWELVVTAHIYKNALNTSSAQSMLAALGLFATNILTVTFWR